MNDRYRVLADDPAVLARTAEALQASTALPAKTPLRFKCRKCTTYLGRAADVPGYGPLFVASWELPPPQRWEVIVDGEPMRDHAARRWLAERSEAIKEYGDVDGPLRDATIALLTLPADMAQDYPDLLMCCEHGYSVVDRIHVLRQLRRAVAGRPIEEKLTLTPGRPDYYANGVLPGGQTTTDRTERRIRFTPTRPNDSAPNGVGAL